MILRLGLMLAVVVVTALAVAGRVDPNTARLSVYGFTVFSIVALVVNVTSRNRLRASIDLMKTTVPIVVHEPILTLPDNIGPLIAGVNALGFDLVGATDTTLKQDKPIRTWILTEPAGDAWVEVGFAGTPIAIFLSQAAGGRFVETAYPRGATIDDPSLLASPVGSSVADALAAQRERLTKEGGPGRQVVTMDDYLSAEATQRASNGGLRIRDHLARVVDPSIRDFAVSVVVDVAAIVVLAVAPATSGG
jgi:hypothetical protein